MEIKTPVTLSKKFTDKLTEMKHILFFALTLVFTQAIFATDYYFNGNEDTYFSNVANWSPSFPGNTIAKGDVVYFQSDVNFTEANIVVEGKMVIEMGIILSSTSKGIIVRHNGLIENNGEINMSQLTIEGKFENGPSSAVFTKKVSVDKNGALQNMISANFEAVSIVSKGIVTNYGKINVIENFENNNLINLLGNSKLSVGGALMSQAGSKTNQFNQANLNGQVIEAVASESLNYFNLLSTESNSTDTL